MRNHTQMLSGFPYGGTLHVGGILKLKLRVLSAPSVAIIRWYM